MDNERRKGGRTIKANKVSIYNAPQLYQKKPVIVQAYRTSEAKDIETLEGVMHVDEGDWIVTGAQGEKYPVKHAIFKEAYEVYECEMCKL